MAAVTFTPFHISSTWDRLANPLMYLIANGVTVGLGQAVYLDDNNKLQLAVGNTTAKAANVLGIVVGVTQQYAETTAKGDGINVYASVVRLGEVMGYDSQFIDGQVIYVSKTVPGGLDTTAPSGGAYDYVVGTALGADVIFVQPGMSSPASV